MEVILKKEVENLGYKDDLVVVKPGYGRNYLIPQGFAILATPSAKKMREENLRQRAHKLAKLKDDATALATKLEGVSLKVGAKVGEKGKIFGSINTIQIADSFKEAGFDIERKHISIVNEPIKEIGNYEATVKLHREVSVTIKFEVVGE
jgi:large subunit ribosomal protein L9